MDHQEEGVTTKYTKYTKQERSVRIRINYLIFI